MRKEHVPANRLSSFMTMIITIIIFMTTLSHMSRDQNPLVVNPLARGNKDLAVSKRVGFVSYRKQNRSACCAVSRRKLLFGALHVATVSTVSVGQEKRASAVS